MNHDSQSERVHTYCAMCVSRCGGIATVEEGRFVALDPDPEHPTGRALCAKGRAAPELVYHPDRLLHPLKRTRPKGEADPGWVIISWDEALDTTAARLREIAVRHGPEAVAFSMASPSTSASEDADVWIERLLRAFGTPNFCASMELCGWGRYFATTYTYGASVPGVYMPDIDNAGCVLLWGYNPNVARLAHATQVAEAKKRGARLIVVDPRRAGLASKADLWLRVRPGTDCALALAITHVMIERSWFDWNFVHDWTNASLLVRADTGRLLRESDIHTGGDAHSFVAWDEVNARPAVCSPATGGYANGGRMALRGEYRVPAVDGTIACRPVFELVAASCAAMRPDNAEAVCGVPRADIERAAQFLWESRPVSYYAWSGVEQQTNSTQIARAIAQLYALTGSFDSRGGNVLFASPPSGNVAADGLPARSIAPAIGVEQRPLGPARWNFITSAAMYTAILEGVPYPLRGLLSFGSNLLVAHANGRRGREALAALDFHVHADLFMNPTAELADIVLPVASAFEREGLKMGFGVSEDAQSLVQLRRPIVPPRGESRSDTEIVFALAQRLGLGPLFWDGDIDAAYRSQLAPSGVTLESLRSAPRGVRVPVHTRYRKFAERAGNGPRGFSTPTRKVELYSEVLLDAGYPPLPEFEEPRVSARSRPDLAERFPLILTTTKSTVFCESQHRNLPSLRRLARDPEVELHSIAAGARGIAAGEWVRIETPHGSVRARARINDSLDPATVCAQHGWWQACAELGAPGYDPFSGDGANVNLIIGTDALDPISGSVPHRAYVCEVYASADD
jgi:anaerobic selenocysteine-containing dehydrogenase